MSENILRKDMPQRGRCWWVMKSGLIIGEDELCGTRTTYKKDPEEGRVYKSFCEYHQPIADERDLLED